MSDLQNSSHLDGREELLQKLWFEEGKICRILTLFSIACVKENSEGSLEAGHHFKLVFGLLLKGQIF